MVSGHLEIKKGYYYVVLSYVDVNGKRHRPWISTGLPEKGNKRKAETELIRIRSTYEPPTEVEELTRICLLQIICCNGWILSRFV